MASILKQESPPELLAKATLCLEIVGKFWPRIRTAHKREDLAVLLMPLPEEALRSAESKEALEALLAKG